MSNDAITAPAWSSGNPTFLGSNMLTASTWSPAPTFYTDVYYASGSTTSSIPQFSLAYGHISGSGAQRFNSLVPSASATRTVYGQYRTLVYGDENTSFNFGTGNTASPDVYVINVNRASYKESLFPGTFNLVLSGSGFLHLTNNSNDVTTVSYLDCGRVYQIVSGSNGNATTVRPQASTAAAGYTVSGSYGLFLPDVGVIVLNPRALALPQVSGGLDIQPNTTNDLVDWYNYTKLRNAMIPDSCSFTLNSLETVSSDYVFVRVPNNQFNYTTNPSIISGSGALLYSTLINNPQTYFTTIGLYNSNQDLLAVAKLSKPLVKDFTKEALIQVKLNW